MPAEPRPPLLNANQRRVVGFALTLLAALGSAALVILALIMVGRLIGFFTGVIWPLAVAGVFALILRPIVTLAERRLRIRRVVAVILLYVIVVIAATGLVVAVAPPVVDQTVDFINYVPALWLSATAYVQQHYPSWMEFAQRHLAGAGLPKLADTLAVEGKALLAQAMPSLRAAFGGLLDGFEFFTHVAIIPVYLFFFLLMPGGPRSRMDRHLTLLQPEIRRDVVFLASEFISIVESFFRGQLLIGLCMGVLLALGFTLIGLKAGLVIGLLLGLLNVVPYLGTILGLATALPLAFFQPGGGWRLVGLVLLVKLIVQCIESWVLTPRIMGHQTGLHPVAIIIAIFFWGHVFGGVLGMLLAVPLTAFFVTLWRWVKQKYFLAADA